MKEQKYHLYLSKDEYSEVLQSLIRLKNSLIAQGRYTDAVDDKYEVVDDPPQYGKDVNDFLCKRLGIKDKTERSFAR